MAKTTNLSALDLSPLGCKLGTMSGAIDLALFAGKSTKADIRAMLMARFDRTAARAAGKLDEHLVWIQCGSMAGIGAHAHKHHSPRVSIVEDPKTGVLSVVPYNETRVASASRLKPTLPIPPKSISIAEEVRKIEAAEPPPTDTEFSPSNVKDERTRTLTLMVQRRGQPQFRERLLKLYGGKCAISGTTAPDALEAAHIIPYKGRSTDHHTNGLLLRADIHTLFDLRLIAIDVATMTILIASKLKNTDYEVLGGKPVHLPTEKAYWPSREALNEQRNESGL